MAAGAGPTHLLVPQGRIMGDLLQWLGIEQLPLGAVEQRGALTVQALPFVRQEDYDHLLWSCDFNAVRGEDSFVRAQWAGRPCCGTSMSRKKTRTGSSSTHSSTSTSKAFRHRPPGRLPGFGMPGMLAPRWAKAGMGCSNAGLKSLHTLNSGVWNSHYRLILRKR